jgi:hypothetical protein
MLKMISPPEGEQTVSTRKADCFGSHVVHY